MARLTSAFFSVLALLVLAATLFGQGKAKSGILQPQMTVEKGTYKEPIGKLGTTPPLQ